jgi:hypothetical protein
MVKLLLPAAIVAAAVVAPLLDGCSSSSTPLATPDSGVVKVQDSGTVQPETGVGDSGTPETESSAPEAGPLPTGTQLVPSKGATVVLEGVTSDDYAAYVDTASNTLYAVAVSGGSPITIATVDPSVLVAVQGQTVLYWANVNALGIGVLSVWTKAGGVHALGTKSFTGAGSYAVSSDNAHVLYFDGTNGALGFANISVGATAGGAPVMLVPAVDLFNQTCSPNIAYAGAYALAAYCLPAGSAGDAGVGGFVVSYTGPSWTATTYSTTATATQLASDPKGTEILVQDATGLSVYPLAGGPAKLIDASGAAGLFTSDGMNVVYTTGAGALKRSPVATPAPITLVASGLANLSALSPDNGWVIGTNTTSATSSNTDLFLASASTAGKTTALAMTPTGSLPPRPFTADSSQAIYYTAYDLNAGTLNAAPTKGGTPATLGSGVFLTYPTKGTKVVFGQNWTANMSTGTVDILGVDTAAASPAVLVSQADGYFYLSADSTKVVYSWSVTPGSSAGVWVLPAP